MSAGAIGLPLLPWQRVPHRAGRILRENLATVTGSVTHSLRDMNS